MMAGPAGAESYSRIFLLLGQLSVGGGLHQLGDLARHRLFGPGDLAKQNIYFEVTAIGDIDNSADDIGRAFFGDGRLAAGRGVNHTRGEARRFFCDLAPKIDAA